jgi:hypothetical protein
MRPFMFLCPNTGYIVQASRREPMMRWRAKSPTRFIRFHALPAGEVTLLIL